MSHHTGLKYARSLVLSKRNRKTVPTRDGTGQDLETLKVPWSCDPRTQEVQNSPAHFPGQDFANKVQN